MAPDADRMVEVEVVASVMQTTGIWWAVAGGWAIDLWLGEQTREHHDVEVVVGRNDQLTLWAGLHGDWELSCLDPMKTPWRPWSDGRQLVPPAFQTKARQGTREFDVFLESVDGDQWTFRRDERIIRPLGEVAIVASGIPVVRPDVQLLYMAKSEEPKNQHDFEVARPQLDAPSARWLRGALSLISPRHPWLAASSGA